MWSWSAPVSSARGPLIISAPPAPQVTLIDAYGPANPRASSGDQSRILRCGYGADEIYSRVRAPLARPVASAAGALERRSALASVRGAAAGGGRRPLRHRHQADARAGRLRARRARRLAPAACGIRTSRPATSSMALLEPECGVLMARRAVRALAAELVQSGTRVSPRAGRVVAVTGYG